MRWGMTRSVFSAEPDAQRDRLRSRVGSGLGTNSRMNPARVGLTVLFGAVVAAGMGALMPNRVSSAGEHPSSRFSLLPSPAHRALTGGLAVLHTPDSEMVLVASGVFEMGSKAIELQLVLDACKREPLGANCEDRMFANERAEHQVRLSSFWMARTEVTVREYSRCVEAGVCDPPPYEQGGERFRKDDLPVSMVTWSDASTYCRFLSQRLPTEAEWERAARGLIGRRFPWGEQYASRRTNHGSYSLDRNDGSDGYGELAPVGSFPDGRTPDGFDDLAGNVAEWTADNYENAYEAMPVTNPQGPPFGAFRVVRGGSYLHALPWLRGAARGYRAASAREPFVGFRCAATSAPQ